MRWRPDDGQVSIHHRFVTAKALVLDDQTLSLIQECGLAKGFTLIAKDQTTPIETAVVRAIYWFGDAQRDGNPVMQFVKYWSCVETFFSQRDDVIGAVSSGLAIALVMGGYSFFPPEEFVSLRRRIRQLYEMRCVTLHSGDYSRLGSQDVRDLSQWAAWLILVMLSLLERGYTSLEQIKKETDRMEPSLLRASASPSSPLPSEQADGP